MPTSILALPITIEQLAVVIRQMSPADRQRLLTLVPELRQEATQMSLPMFTEAQAVVERIRLEVIQALGGQGLSSDEPFIGDLTLGQYLGFSDEERNRLWEMWTDVALDTLEERDVRPDAVPAR